VLMTSCIVQRKKEDCLDHPLHTVTTPLACMQHIVGRIKQPKLTHRMVAAALALAGQNAGLYSLA